MILKTKLSKRLLAGLRIAALRIAALRIAALGIVPVIGAFSVLTFSVLTFCGASTSESESGGGNPVVYIADGDLYTIPINGGANIQLNYDARNSNSVTHFAISPDSQRVVYRAASDARPSVYELWSASLNEVGASIRLNKVLANDRTVTSSFVISSDTSVPRVVYMADADAVSVNELYSVLIGGGTSVKLNGTLASDRDVSEFKITPNGGRVVYLADETINDVNELYFVGVGNSTGSSTKISRTLVAGRNVTHFAISPNGSRVVYRADATTHEVDELYSAPIAAASSAVKINSPLAADGDVLDFAISTDGLRVIYRADATTDDVNELYSAPIASAATATSAVKINVGLIAAGDVEDDYAISADALRVIYRADATTDGVNELYSAPFATASASASASVKIGALATGRSVARFVISPDSKRLVYQSDTATNNVFDLYSVPIDIAASATATAIAAASVRLIGEPPPGAGNILAFAISADGMRVVLNFKAQTSTSAATAGRLYSSPIDAKNTLLLTGDGVRTFTIGR